MSSKVSNTTLLSLGLTLVSTAACYNYYKANQVMKNAYENLMIENDNLKLLKEQLTFIEEDKRQAFLEYIHVEYLLNYLYNGYVFISFSDLYDDPVNLNNDMATPYLTKFKEFTNIYNNFTLVNGDQPTKDSNIVIDYIKGIEKNKMEEYFKLYAYVHVCKSLVYLSKNTMLGEMKNFANVKAFCDPKKTESKANKISKLLHEMVWGFDDTFIKTIDNNIKMLDFSNHIDSLFPNLNYDLILPESIIKCVDKLFEYVKIANNNGGKIFNIVVEEDLNKLQVNCSSITNIDEFVLFASKLKDREKFDIIYTRPAQLVFQMGTNSNKDFDIISRKHLETAIRIINSKVL